MNAPANHSGDGMRPALAIAAMLLAVAAAVAFGQIAQAPAAATTAAPDESAAPAWLHDIEAGADHIDPDELAQALLAGDDVLVVDVRPADEFAGWHLPGAVNLSVPDVVGDAGAALFAVRKPARIVLCSNGPAHPAQAWVELRRQGRTNALVLDGGLDAFFARVLTPPSLRPDAEAASAKADGARWPLVRAFFLGAGKAPAAASLWANDPAELTQPTMVSPAWLQPRLGAVAVLDVRSAPEHDALHIPGSVRLDLPSLRVRAGDRDHFLRSDAELAERFGALGLTATQPVVLVADDKPHDATMAAMALLRLGHRALAVLEGGMLRWAAERRPLVDVATAVAPTTYAPKPGADDFTITADELAAASKAGAMAVLDVRPPAAFAGTTSTEPRAGHIPGARNRPFTADLLRTDGGQWLRPRAELAAAYDALLPPGAGAVAVSCRTGHSASHAYFVLRYLLGRSDVRWYAGSWTEWSARADLPAELGDKKP
jgi:3-mercaptopyruvate sulfurtransferase SseA